MVERLSGVYRPERIYFYGSVARGDAGPDSDYDLPIVVPGSARCAGHEIVGVPEPVASPRVPPSTVAREGIVLYGR
jgi:predicted nucleotidyltransferase